jgi:deoxyadenosine/deoxycytidine kinase
VIYLHAGTRTLAERVRRRALEYERTIEEDYLAQLADAYARFFHRYDDAPVMAVNSEHLDFAASGGDLELLLEHVAAMRGQRAYFNVGD